MKKTGALQTQTTSKIDTGLQKPMEQEGAFPSPSKKEPQTPRSKGLKLNPLTTFGQGPQAAQVNTTRNSNANPGGTFGLRKNT